MAFGVAFYVGIAATVAASYVESEAQKEKARTIRGIRSREAEDITKLNIQSGEQTQATADRFKGPERTALTESQDRRNIESLREVQEDVREGTDPSDTGFAGTSQTFATKREAQRAKDAKRAEEDRLASARFLSPGQSTVEEQRFIQDLGIENQGLALEARGRKQVADAQVAGVGLKNQGLVTLLKIISYAASAYSLATAAAGTAAKTGAQKAYEEGAKKVAKEAAEKGIVSQTNRTMLAQLAKEAGVSPYSSAVFDANIWASGVGGASEISTAGREAFKAGLANSPDPFLQTLYTPAKASQVSGSAVPGFAPTNFAEVGAHVSPAYARGSLADQALAKKLAGTGEFLQLGTKSTTPPLRSRYPLFDDPELLELLGEFEFRNPRGGAQKTIFNR